MPKRGRWAGISQTPTAMCRTIEPAFRRCSRGGREPPLLTLADMVGQDQQITTLAVAVARMRAEHPLDAEAQALEDRAASMLLFQHLDDHLVHTEVARGVEDRLS